MPCQRAAARALGRAPAVTRRAEASRRVLALLSAAAHRGEVCPQEERRRRAARPAARLALRLAARHRVARLAARHRAARPAARRRAARVPARHRSPALRPAASNRAELLALTALVERREA